MGSLKNIFSRRDDNVEWRDTVIARLDSLAESQDQIRRDLAGNAAAENPTPRARRRGTILLLVMVILIVLSVSATLDTSVYRDEAVTALNQAQTADAEVANDLQPVQDIINKHGAKYLISHPSQSVLSDLQAAEGPAKQASEDTARANHLDFEWVTGQYFGQIVLAVSSAFLGAIAGWLVIPALAADRARRRRGHR